MKSKAIINPMYKQMN